MDYGILYEAWIEIGADVAGLDWNKFVKIVEEKIKADKDLIENLKYL